MAFLPALYSATLLHEAGHLAAGVMCGFRFRRLSVGPFVFALHDGAWRFWVRWRQALSDAGSTTLNPRHPERLRARLAALAAAGPLASIATAAVAWSHFPAPGFRGAFFLLLAAASALQALRALWPVPWQGHPSDGLLLFDLLMGGPRAARLEAFYRLTGERARGRRAREWSEDDLRAGIAVEDCSYHEAMLRLMAFHHAVDSGRTGEAEKHLRRFKELRGSFPPYMAALADIEDAAFTARYHKAAAVARELLERARRSMDTELELPFLIAEAAVLGAEGEREEACKAAEAAINGLRRLPKTDLNEAEMEWLSGYLKGE